MLLETIQRNDTNHQVKLVCVEVLRAKKQPIPVETVPTLVTLPDRRLLTGKAVFDYLLLPGKGKLLIKIDHNNGSGPSPGSGPAPAPAPAPAPIEELDPMAFTLGGSKGFGDAFTAIEHEGSTIDSGHADRLYQWTKISDQEHTDVSISSFSPEETRSKKQSVDMETFKMQRDMDLQKSDINTTMVIPPSFTR
jgi:hypothetical protein